MTDKFYSSVEAVLEDSGIIPSDMGISGVDEDTKLEAKVAEWLLEAKAIIDADRERDFHAEVEAGTIPQIPPCIHGIARRITLNIANIAKMNRKSPTIQVNDYTTKLIENDPFTEEIQRDLDKCQRKPRFIGMI